MVISSFRTLVIATCGALALAAGVAAADPDAAKGVVAVAYDGIPDKVHPVTILDIDGKVQPQPLRDTYYLEPGKHTLRLGAVIGDFAGVQRGNVDRKDAKRTLEIEVEAGKRYLIGAKLEGRTAAEWTPVVYKVEDRKAAESR
jgi:hypothetical protein